MSSEEEESQYPAVIQAINEWRGYCRRYTKRTQMHYERTIKAFHKGLPGDVKYVGQIKVAHLRDYVNNLLNRGLTNRTGNAYGTVLKSFCRWASDQYEIPNEASKLKQLPEEPPNARFLTYPQYVAVLRAVDRKTRQFIEFLANTGLRATEFLNLTWDNIDENDERMVLTGKGRKRRTIPLNSRCKKILARLPQSGRRGPVFTQKMLAEAKEQLWIKMYGPKSKELLSLRCARTHKVAVSGAFAGIRRKTLYCFCTNVATAAGIKCFGPHALRHLFATELLTRGVKIAFVSKLLGHSSIRTTEQIYIHWVPSDLDNTTEVLCRSRRKKKA